VPVPEAPVGAPPRPAISVPRAIQALR